MKLRDMISEVPKIWKDQQIYKKTIMINKKYIAIEGAIGVGKTTLAKISDTINCDTLLEDYIDNPFLKKFYDDNQSNSFTTNVFFT